jgi:Pex2 / Pex12 amino terminal region
MLRSASVRLFPQVSRVRPALCIDACVLQIHVLLLIPSKPAQVYPWAHAAAEGLTFGYQLFYLLELSPYYSPLLHLLGQTVCRVSGRELVGFLEGFLGFWGLLGGGGGHETG